MTEKIRPEQILPCVMILIDIRHLMRRKNNEIHSEF
jgi:hypothetical protein